MYASYQIIIQILQLAYTTQACILNLKAYAMQASTWICTYLMQSIKVHELAPPTCVLLLSKNFDPLTLFNVLQCCPLFVHFVSISPKAFISLYNLSPFVINFYKRCASYLCKGLHWGRWLTLESSFFMDTTTYVGMTPFVALEIPHVGSFDLDTYRWGTSPMS